MKHDQIRYLLSRISRCQFIPAASAVIGRFSLTRSCELKQA
jgi:hypothetical protein